MLSKRMTFTFLTSLDVYFTQNALLSDYTTFQLGGPCQCLIECQTPAQLENIVSELNDRRIDFMLIGGGSNLLVSDQGLDTVVIRYVSELPLIDFNGDRLRVSGSTSLDELAYQCAEEGLEGLNCTTGIPGTVGGAIVGNAGAFGKQIGDVLESVTLLKGDGTKVNVAPVDLGLRYRHSDLKDRNDIVLAAGIRLRHGNREQLLKEREEILALRASKHPNLATEPCAGSFFRNIEPTSSAEKRQAAGWFLEEAGAKKLFVGGAKIFDKHANIIIKDKDCTAKNVLDLSEKMKKIVKEKFNLDLVREVRLIGFPKGSGA